MIIVNAKYLEKNLKSVDYKDIVTFVNNEEVYISLKQIWQLYVLAQKNNKQMSVLQMLIDYALVGEIDEFLKQYGNLLRPDDKDSLDTVNAIEKYDLTF